MEMYIMISPKEIDTEKDRFLIIDSGYKHASKGKKQTDR